MVKSIFELERRFDFDKEFKRLFDYLSKAQFNSEFHLSSTFWNVADYYFEKWSNRLTAINSSDYFEDIGINIKGFCDNTEKLYIMQFVLNYISFLESSYYLPTKYKAPYKTVLQNILSILESLNYKLAEDEEGRSFFTKRDADVDSVLDILENEDDIRLLLLGYNDFRIEKDITAKRTILKRLGDYIEPKRQQYKGYNSTLTDNVFHLLNSMYIRHNHTKVQPQYQLSNEEYILWYDKLFKMILHIIRTEEISKTNKEVVVLKHTLKNLKD